MHWLAIGGVVVAVIVLLYGVLVWLYFVVAGEHI